MADAEIVTLPTKVLREPVQKIVEQLERLLDRAKRGDIRAFAYAVVREGFWTEEGSVSADDEPVGPALIAAASILQTRLVMSKLEDSIVGEEV